MLLPSTGSGKITYFLQIFKDNMRLHSLRCFIAVWMTRHVSVTLTHTFEGIVVKTPNWKNYKNVEMILENSPSRVVNQRSKDLLCCMLQSLKSIFREKKQKYFLLFPMKDSLKAKQNCLFLVLILINSCSTLCTLTALKVITQNNLCVCTVCVHKTD